MKYWPFKFVKSAENRSQIVIHFNEETKNFYAEELLAMILLKMKENAEDYLGTLVKSAIITVPLSFNDSQRQAIKDAGMISGLQVEQIMNESSAAAISYYHKNYSNFTTYAKNILIFSIGAGSFDISLINIEDGIFEVKATLGNSNLGGQDFDCKIVDFCAADFLKKSGINIKNNKSTLVKLKTICERSKIMLSSSTQVSIEIDNLAEGIDYYTIITRSQFEDLNMDYFNECLNSIENVLSNAGVNKKQINKVILIGRSSRIPKVKELLQNFFYEENIFQSLNNYEAAYGAAIEGAILSGKGSSFINDLVIIDVTSLDIYFEDYNCNMSVLIPKCSVIPIRRTKFFTTIVENQTEICIQVFEGQIQSVKYYELLGNFIIQGVYPAPKGVPQIEVTFEIDTSGILTASAQDKFISKYYKISMINNKGGLNKREIEIMIEKIGNYKLMDEENIRKIKARNSLQDYCYNMKSFFDENLGNDMILDEDRDIIGRKIQDAVLWLEKHQDVKIEEYLNKHQELKILLVFYEKISAAKHFEDRFLS